MPLITDKPVVGSTPRRSRRAASASQTSRYWRARWSWSRQLVPVTRCAIGTGHSRHRRASAQRVDRQPGLDAEPAGERLDGVEQTHGVMQR